MIISVAAARVRLVIFPGCLLFLSRSKQGSKKQTIFQEKAVTKNESRYPRKFIPRKLQILAIFGDPQIIIPSKIPSLMGI